MCPTVCRSGKKEEAVKFDPLVSEVLHLVSLVVTFTRAGTRWRKHLYGSTFIAAFFS